jgi:hypothetical protein
LGSFLAPCELMAGGGTADDNGTGTGSACSGNTDWMRAACAAASAPGSAVSEEGTTGATLTEAADVTDVLTESLAGTISLALARTTGT